MSHAWRTDGAVEQYIDAAPADVYERIADVTETGDRSTECRSCTWLPGRDPGTVGARFRGRNRKGFIRWSRVCEVTVAEPGCAFAFRTVPSRWDPSRADSTTWSYTLVADGGGTRVTHAYEVIKPPLPPFKTIFGWLFPHHRDMRPHMTHTLQALRAQTERTAVH